MKLAYLAAFAVAVSVQVGGLRIDRRDARGGETISDVEREVRAARQYRPGASKHDSTPAFLHIRQVGPSATPCPVGSQRVGATCVPCADLGRADNNAPGQPCGVCLNTNEVVGADETCNCPVDTTGPLCEACAILNRENTGEPDQCGNCLAGFSDINGTCFPLEFLINPSFEAGATFQDAPPWVRSGDVQYSRFEPLPYTDSLPCHSGTRCWTAGALGEQPAVVSQQLRVLPDETYSVSFWVGIWESGAQEEQELVVRCLLPDGSVVCSATIHELATLEPNTWTRIDRLTFVPVGTGLATIEFAGKGNGDSWVFVDDVSVTAVV